MSELSSQPHTLRERFLASRYGRGDLGFLPVIFALIVVAIVFEFSNDTFITARNISNLALQIGVLGIMTLGMELVLLVGEIDLSAGSVAGFSAAAMSVLSAVHNQPAWVAVGVAILLGAAIGVFQGLWVVIVRAPSFIVTLTGLLVWQGCQHLTLGYQVGEIEVDNKFITGIAGTYLPLWAGWGLVAIIAIVAVLICIRHLRLEPRAVALPACVRAIFYPVVAAFVVVLLDTYSGVPYLLLLLLVLAVVLTVVAERTPFGVHILAVGGNAEAARRAGVPVGVIKVAVLCVCSTLAALAGIVSVSRQYGVDSNTGGGNLVLNAIAATVIGGTSLFGGRGRVVGGLLGAVVISAVANGLDLLGISADVQTIVTGLILLAAVSVDVVARRRRISSGAAGA